MIVPSLANDVVPFEGISTCVCINGYMFQNGKCVLCKVGYYCSEGFVNPCPFGRFSPVLGLGSADECLMCSNKNVSTMPEWDIPRTSVFTCLGDFDINEDDIKTDKIIEKARIIFGFQRFNITHTYIRSRITYTITMQPDFVANIMSVLLNNP